MLDEEFEGSRFEIGFEDEAYPQNLRNISDSPSKLYGYGNINALKPGLAIIGARKATPYGLSCAHHFAQIAADKGVTIISGGALGCDSQAHQGALEVKGKTVVVLGGGCNRIYPKRNKRLFQEVIDAGGAVISEQPWNQSPLPFMFRLRNRIIAGLADAVLIVEAGLPSGTFSTADEALAQGKEVLVVPGAITSANSRGSNRLLYQGAIPIVDDESFEAALFDSIGVLRQPVSGNDVSLATDDPLLSALMAEPMAAEDLFELAKQAFGESEARSYMNRTLAEAETKHYIERYPSGKWGPIVR